MPDYARIADLFKAAAHPVRLQILDLLRGGGEVCVCHMEAALGRRQAYVSQQLMILREAGLVQARKDGLRTYYRLVDARAASVLEAVFGPAQSPAQPLEDCPCPRCAAHKGAAARSS